MVTFWRNTNRRAAARAKAPPPHISIRCCLIMPRVWWQLTAMATQKDRTTAARTPRVSGVRLDRI